MLHYNFARLKELFKYHNIGITTNNITIKKYIELNKLKITEIQPKDIFIGIEKENIYKILKYKGIFIKSDFYLLNLEYNNILNSVKKFYNDNNETLDNVHLVNISFIYFCYFYSKTKKNLNWMIIAGIILGLLVLIFWYMIFLYSIGVIVASQYVRLFKKNKSRFYKVFMPLLSWFYFPATIINHIINRKK